MKKSKKVLFSKRIAQARWLYRVAPPHPFIRPSLWRANPKGKFEFKNGQIVEVYP